MSHGKERSATRSEEYAVEFDLLRRGTEFWTREKESLFFYTKNDHRRAEKQVVNKYRGRGDKIKIVSVKYQ